MITTIVIDDEARGRSVLIEKLKTHCPNINVIGEAGDGVEAIDLIERLKPRLIFLDIVMPRLNGLDMLESLKEKNFFIIFTTAFDQFAIRAIRYSAFDYLLKPIEIEELKSSIARIESLENRMLSRQVELLQEYLKQQKNPFHTLAISTNSGVIFLQIAHITHLEAKSNYTFIYMLDKSKVTVTKTLREILELLPGDRFLRVHHSYVVHLAHITKYIKGDGGQIELSTGFTVDVSRKHKDDFLRLIRQDRG